MARARKRKAVYAAEDGDRGRVLLFGHEMPHVIRCSPSEGWMEMYVTDMDGRGIDDGEGNALGVRVHGKVEYLAGGVE